MDAKLTPFNEPSRLYLKEIVNKKMCKLNRSDSESVTSRLIFILSVTFLVKLVHNMAIAGKNVDVSPICR